LAKIRIMLQLFIMKIQSKKLLKIISFSVMSSVVACGFHIPIYAKTTKSTPKQQTAAEWFKTFGKQWLKDFTATLGHELGHALTAKAFTGEPININLGLSDPTVETIKLGKPPITINNPFPMGGYTALTRPLSRAQTIIMALAGPTSGALTYYLINLAKEIRKNNSAQKKRPFKELLKRALIDPDIYTELVVNLLPIIPGNDGTRALKELFPRLNSISFLERHPVLGFFIGTLILNAVRVATRHYLTKKLSHYDNSLAEKEEHNADNRMLMFLATSLLKGISFATRKQSA